MAHKKHQSPQSCTTGDHWDFDVSIFLKIDRFEGAKPHSPLNAVVVAGRFILYKKRAYHKS